MPTLRCASFKNNFLYQIQRILTNTQDRAYSFMIKRVPRCFNIFTRKNRSYYVSLPILCIGPSLSRDHQTVTMNLNIYCFEMPRLKTETRGEILPPSFGG